MLHQVGVSFDLQKMLLLVLDKEIDLNYNLPCRITGQHNIHALLHCFFASFIAMVKQSKTGNVCLQSERSARLVNRLLQPVNTNE